MGDRVSDPAPPPRIAFERATPVLAVADYPAARDFYTHRLGFEVVEEGGDPPRFGIFRCGMAFLFLDAWHGSRVELPRCWSAYFHLSDVDRLADDYQSREVVLRAPPHDTVYGMREFELVDLDGNVLCFGADIVERA